MTKVIEGQLSASGIRFGIVAARFNEFVVGPLIEGALDTITRHGGSRQEVTIVRVPGSFEIPLACKKLAQTKTVDAIIAIGAVIRGSTTHYDYVCSQATSGIGAVGLECELPVTFGVITTDTIEQAIERSGCKAGNKGSDAALAAIEMVSVLRQLAK